MDDRQPVLASTAQFQGKRSEDKEYISKALTETLEARDVHLLTKVRKM